MAQAILAQGATFWLRSPYRGSGRSLAFSGLAMGPRDSVFQRRRLDLWIPSILPLPAPRMSHRVLELDKNGRIPLHLTASYELTAKTRAMRVAWAGTLAGLIAMYMMVVFLADPVSAPSKAVDSNIFYHALLLEEGKNLNALAIHYESEHVSTESTLLSPWTELDMLEGARTLSTKIDVDDVAHRCAWPRRVLGNNSMMEAAHGNDDGGNSSKEATFFHSLGQEHGSCMLVACHCDIGCVKARKLDAMDKHEGCCYSSCGDHILVPGGQPLWLRPSECPFFGFSSLASSPGCAGFGPGFLEEGVLTFTRWPA